MSISFGDWLNTVFTGVRWEGDNLRFDCPVCMGSQGGRLCASASLSKQVWRCFNCEKSGRALSLVTYVENCTEAQAEDIVDLEANAKRDRTPLQPSKRLTLPDEYLPLFGEPYKRLGRVGKEAINYALSRGWNKVVAKRYRLGYCVTGRYAGRIIIPFYSYKGTRLVGFQGRSFRGDEPRYLGPSVPATVFNIHRQKGKDLFFLHEGPANPLVTDGAALCGSHITYGQVDLIARTGVPVCIWLDGDETGRRKTLEVAKKLYSRTVTYVYLDHVAKSADDNPKEVSRVRQHMFRVDRAGLARIALRVGKRYICNQGL